MLSCFSKYNEYLAYSKRSTGTSSSGTAIFYLLTYSKIERGFNMYILKFQKKITHYCLIMVLVFIPGVSFAVFGEGEVKRFYVTSTGEAYVGLVKQLPSTCKYFDEYFKFDATTPGGKNMLGVLMSAKLANKYIHVKYGIGILNSIGIR